MAIIRGEERMFQVRQKGLAGEAAVIKRQMSKFREEIVALKAQMKADAKQLQLVHVEIKDVRTLLKKGFARKPKLTQLQRQAAKIEGDRAENAALIARARQNIGEAELRVVNLHNARLAEAAEDLQEVRNQINDLEKRLQAATDVLRQTEAKASQASVSLAAQKSVEITITRATVGGPQSIEASEASTVFPGDIIRVPGSFEALSRWSADAASFRIQRASD